jgi:hypothetical protein
MTTEQVDELIGKIRTIRRNGYIIHQAYTSPKLFREITGIADNSAYIIMDVRLVCNPYLKDKIYFVIGDE